MANLELIIGIGIGAGLIFSLFAFFRNFYYMPTVNTAEASGANVSRQSNFLFFFVFMGALIFFMYLFSPKNFELPQTKSKEEKSQPTTPAQLNTSPSEVYRTSLNVVKQEKENDELNFKKSIEQKIDSIEELVVSALEKEVEIVYEKEASEPEVPQTRYMVQLSASDNFEFAMAFASKIKIKYSDYSVCLFNPAEGNTNKVLIGGYISKPDAIHLQRYLEQKEQKDFWVIELPPSQFENIVFIK